MLNIEFAILVLLGGNVFDKLCDWVTYLYQGSADLPEGGRARWVTCYYFDVPSNSLVKSAAKEEAVLEEGYGRKYASKT